MSKCLELDSNHSNIIAKLAIHGFNKTCSYCHPLNATQLEHAAATIHTKP